MLYIVVGLISFLLGLLLGFITGFILAVSAIDKFILKKYDEKAELLINGEKYKIVKVQKEGK